MFRSPQASAPSSSPLAASNGASSRVRRAMVRELGLAGFPDFLTGVASDLAAVGGEELDSGTLLHQLALRLRREADIHPGFRELRELADLATCRLGDLFPCDHRWDSGESSVMAEERRVWGELRRRLLLAKSPHTPDLNTLLDAYEREFGWWATTGELGPSIAPIQRALYVATRGEFPELVRGARQAVHPAPPLEAVTGALGSLGAEDVASIAEDVRRDGYRVFPGLLSSTLCEGIERYSRSVPVKPIGPGAEGAPGLPLEQAKRCGAVRFKIDESVMLQQQELLSLAFDPTLVAVAREYMGTEVVYSTSLLRWSQFSGQPASSSAAQLFHFDLNQLNFLKVLIYITDIGPEAGPYCFVRGSHLHKPAELMRDGRLSDEEVAHSYPAGDVKEICGPRGTIILTDTRGLHKGRVLEAGDRLVYFSRYSATRAGKGGGVVQVQDSPWARSQKSQHPRLWHRVKLVPANQPLQA